MRRFTVLALTNCEYLSLYVRELACFENEFPKEFDDLFSEAADTFKGCKKMKRKAIKICSEAMEEHKN